MGKKRGEGKEKLRKGKGIVWDLRGDNKRISLAKPTLIRERICPT